MKYTYIYKATWMITVVLSHNLEKLDRKKRGGKAEKEVGRWKNTDFFSGLGQFLFCYSVMIADGHVNYFFNPISF